jgi:hypothetical protein
MTATQDQDISTNIYNKYVLRDPNIINNTCIKYLEKSETTQHATGASRALTKGDHTNCQNLPSRIS